MSFDDPFYRRIFFEVHSGLPREGPGDEASLRRAWDLVTGLSPRPVVLDIGCGPGLQTLDLAHLTQGLVLGLDNHKPFLRDLARGITRSGLARRMMAMAGDMNRLPVRPATVDLIWSEGAAYQMGFANALESWKFFLKPRGWLAVTEAVWLKPGAPEDVRRCWSEYPDITDIAGVLKVIDSCGYEVAGQFTLPESSWWDHYYTPMEQRLGELRRTYSGDEKALGILDEHQREIDIYRRYSAYYGYEFFVCRLLPDRMTRGGDKPA